MVGNPYLGIISCLPVIHPSRFDSIVGIPLALLQELV
jgi:hypothetical protein